MLKIAGVAALLQLCAVGGAAAQSYADFERFCIETDADPEAVQAAAGSAGWRAFPAGMIAAMNDGEDEGAGDDWGIVRAGYSAPGSAVGILLVGEGAPPLDIGPDVRAQTCGMATETVAAGSAQARLKDLLSIGDAIDHELDEGLWLFSKSREGVRDERALLQPGSDVAAAARERGLRFVGSGEADDGMVMLIFGRLVAEGGR